MRSLPLFVASAVGLVQAATVPVHTVKVYKEDSVLLAPATLRITGVKDLRVLGRENPRLLGSTAVGVFQERMHLWSSDPVDLSVSNLLRRWFPETLPKSDTVQLSRPDSLSRDTARTPVPTDSARTMLTDSVKKDTAKPVLPLAAVRIEILSFESWAIPTTNPAKARARVRLRIVADEEGRKGRIAEVEAGADRDGLNTPEDQAELLRLSLRKAMLSFLGQEWRTAIPLDSTGMLGPEPDPWTDAVKRPSDRPGSGTRTLVHLALSYGVAGYSFGARGAVYYEPEELWNKEYWAAVRLRDPRLEAGEENSSPWVGEVGGGLGWQRRLGAGGSPFVLVNAAGGLLGVERYDHRTTSGMRREGGLYVGAEGRSALRYEPAGMPGLSGEAGVLATLRLPSGIQVFDLGLTFDAGWRF